MSLYEELGGDPAISAALDDFYVRVMGDPRVNVFFDGVDVERVKRKQRAFLAMAFGGPNEYDGRDLATAHARARAGGLDEARFEAFMGHFRDTLTDLGVPDPKVEEVMAIAYGGKDQVLGRAS